VLFLLAGGPIFLDRFAPGFRMTAAHCVGSVSFPWGRTSCEEDPDVQTTKQVTIFLENKPGRLANVLAALAADKVNIMALSVMDKHEHSVLRLVSDNPAKTMQIVQTLNTPCTETEVLVVELRNQPGALSHVCEILATEHINIDYAYCSSGGRNGKVVGIFKLSNTEKAMRVLGQSPNASSRRLEKRVVRDQRTYQAKAKANNSRQK
jgi:hypothetical protein